MTHTCLGRKQQKARKRNSKCRFLKVFPKRTGGKMKTKSILFSGNILFFLIVLYLPSYTLAASKVTCQDKVLDTVTLTGTYLGWFEAEEGFHSLGLKLADGEDVYIVASEEDAEKFFGREKGQNVSVTYNLEQFWLDEGGCYRENFLKSGKVLASIGNKATPLPLSESLRIIHGRWTLDLGDTLMHGSKEDIEIKRQIAEKLSPSNYFDFDMNNKVLSAAMGGEIQSEKFSIISSDNNTALLQLESGTTYRLEIKNKNSISFVDADPEIRERAMPLKRVQ